MRIIKFRGKRFGNEEWVYGYYGLTMKGKSYIESIESHISMSHNIVIPETVGQFTGLTDKNGKDIFEGDVLVWGGDRDAFFEVFWHDYECRYSLRVHWQGNRCGGYVPLFDANHSFEIIGNIYESPELLK